MAEIRETAVELIAGEKYLTYSTNDRKYIGRLRRRIEEHPGVVEVLIDDPEFGLSVRCPASWFNEPRPKPKRKPLSEEQRAEVAERMAAARKAQKLNTQQ